MTKISQYANTLAGITSTDLMDVSKDLGGGSYQTNKMTFATLLSGIRLTTDTLLGGQALSALAQSPAVGQDGFVLTWNNGSGEYTLAAAAGGGDSIYTADDSIGAGTTRTVTIPLDSELLFGGAASLIVTGANIPGAAQGGNVGVKMGAEKPLAPLHIGIGYNGGGNATPSTPLTGHTTIFQNNNAATDPSRIAIVAGATDFSGIDFGDVNDIDIGRIFYDHSEDAMAFYTNTALAMKIQSDQTILMNSLSGSGAQMVVVDNNGQLATQAIPGGGNGIYGGSDTLSAGVTTATLGTVQSVDKLILKGVGNGSEYQFAYVAQDNLNYTRFYNNGLIEISGSIQMNTITGGSNANIVINGGGGTTALFAKGNFGVGVYAYSSNSYALQAVASGGSSQTSIRATDAVLIGLTAPVATAPLAMLAVENGDVRFLGAADSNLFYLDQSADFVGIGVIPTVKFHVVGTTLIDGGFQVQGASVFDIHSTGTLIQIGYTATHVGIGEAAVASHRLKVGGGVNGGMNYMFEVESVAETILLRIGTAGALTLNSTTDTQVGIGGGSIGNTLFRLGGGIRGGQNKIYEILDGNGALRMEMDSIGNIAFVPRAETDGLTIDGTLMVFDCLNNRIGIKKLNPTQALEVVGNVKISGDYHVGANVGQTQVLTIAGGGTGDVATITVSGGIVTAITLVP